jgi:hypothetical protein
MSDERQIAALREEIRRAGRAHCAFRWNGGLILALAAAVISAVVWAVQQRLAIDGWGLGPGGCHPIYGPVWAWVLRELRMPLVLIGATAGGESACAVPLHINFRQRSLRSRLRRVSRANLAAIHRSLAEEGQDARRIAEPVLRQMLAHMELAPSAAPDARGDEASPAEVAP